MPEPAELAAIVAAVEALWPRPAAPIAEAPEPVAPAWRFSGRWWQQAPPGDPAGAWGHRAWSESPAGSGRRTASASSSR